MADPRRRALLQAAGLLVMGAALPAGRPARAQDRPNDQFRRLHEAATRYAPIVVEEIFDWDAGLQRFALVQTVRSYSCAPLSSPDEMLEWAC